MMIKRRVTFQYMGVYWSMPKHKFEVLMIIIEDGQPFDLDDRGARQLARKPKHLDYIRIT
jgi:hypothetical protein